MRHNLFFQIIICILIICSSLYIRYRKDTDAVSAMANGIFTVTQDNSNMTFSDFAENILNAGAQR